MSIKFPEQIDKRITDDFLLTFKAEIENIFINHMTECPTYWNYYQWFDSTQGNNDALKIACSKTNFLELYEYLNSLEWFDYDILNSELTEQLYKRGLIMEGTPEDAYPIANGID